MKGIFCLINWQPPWAWRTRQSSSRLHQDQVCAPQRPRVPARSVQWAQTPICVPRPWSVPAATQSWGTFVCAVTSPVHTLTHLCCHLVPPGVCCWLDTEERNVKHNNGQAVGNRVQCDQRTQGSDRAHGSAKWHLLTQNLSLLCPFPLLLPYLPSPIHFVLSFPLPFVLP